MLIRSLGLGVATLINIATAFKVGNTNFLPELLGALAAHVLIVFVMYKAMRWCQRALKPRIQLPLKPKEGPST